MVVEVRNTSPMPLLSAHLDLMVHVRMFPIQAQRRPTSHRSRWQVHLGHHLTPGQAAQVGVVHLATSPPLPHLLHPHPPTSPTLPY